MDIVLTRRLIIAGGLAVATFTGWEIAEGSHALVGFVVAVIALFGANRMIGALPDSLLAGAVVLGYLVGNRGFAQVSVSSLPLLPGELALGLGLACLIWRSAHSQRLPWRRDALNYALLSWLALGAIRLPFDFRTYGIVAVRDFAMVYYTLFFFLAQGWTEHAKSRAWLESCLSVGFALVVPAFLAFRRAPDFFINRFVIGNAPLIFVKSDVAGGFMVAGAFWFLHRYSKRRDALSVLLVALNLSGAIFSNSRAALVALIFCCGWTLALRVKPWLRLLSFLAALGLLALMVEAALPRDPGETSRLYHLYESVVTIFDVTGDHTPENADLGDKSDNNRFRTIWWGEVLRETREGNPWLGLGFGHDLAERFGEIYFPEGSEEFSARSPHNFLLTVFARMGLAGFVTLTAVLLFVARGTWRDRQHSDTRVPHPGWVAAWAILVSACLGVVLEGPMGAVVFWTLLGLANASSVETESSPQTIAALEPEQKIAPEAVAALPSAGPSA